MASLLFERRVRFDHEDLDAVRMMIRADSEDLAPDAHIEVEVGARWSGSGGHRQRVGGQWIPCVVVSDHPRELVVRLRA